MLPVALFAIAFLAIPGNCVETHQQNACTCSQHTCIAAWALALFLLGLVCCNSSLSEF